jgi:shikimate kinase
VKNIGALDADPARHNLSHRKASDYIMILPSSIAKDEQERIRMKTCTQKKAPNIALIGFRATGKSSIGRFLARHLGWRFVDMDERLVASFGQDIQSWVRQHNWESFREAESKLLESLSEQTGLVVGTGGGVILREANRQVLRNRFLVVWLKASAGTIYTRLVHDPLTPSQRPPLTELPLRAEIEQTLSERWPIYEQTANLIVDTEADPVEKLALGLANTLRKRLLHIESISEPGAK